MNTGLDFEFSGIAEVDYLADSANRISEDLVLPFGAADTLCHDIKGYVGISVTVDIVDPGELPRSRGKAQRVIDQRGEK